MTRGLGPERSRNHLFYSDLEVVQHADSDITLYHETNCVFLPHFFIHFTSLKSVRNIGNINQHSFVILCEPVRWACPLGRWVGWTIILLHCCLPGVRAPACPSSQERHHQPSMDPYSLGPLWRWIHTGVSLPQPALALRRGIISTQWIRTLLLGFAFEMDT